MRNESAIKAAASFVPDWNAQHFHILDPSQQWSPAVARELSDRWNARPGYPAVIAWHDAGKLQHGLDPGKTKGLILFFDGIEKGCLAILSRLMDAPESCPIAAVIHQAHADLVPVLLESGVKTVILDPINHVPVADWCLAIIDITVTNEKDAVSRLQNAKTLSRLE